MKYLEVSLVAGHGFYSVRWLASYKGYVFMSSKVFDRRSDAALLLSDIVGLN